MRSSKTTRLPTQQKRPTLLSNLQPTPLRRRSAEAYSKMVFGCICGGGEELRIRLDSRPPLRLVWFYFHSQTLEIVLPEASTSYSNAPQVLFTRASFFDAVRKNSMPR